MDDVENVLWQLHGSPNPSMNAGRDSFRIYSVSKLFHELWNARMGVPSAVILPLNFSVEQELINDTLEFTEGISFNLHEKEGTMPHSSLSYVQLWRFSIMKQCCGPRSIDRIPGKHCTLSSNLVNKARAAYLGSRIRCWNPTLFVMTCLRQGPCQSSPSHQRINAKKQ
jgi:hypothetical protein